MKKSEILRRERFPEPGSEKIKRRIWSLEEIMLLTELFLGCRGVTNIAIRQGRTERATMQKINSLHLYAPRVKK